MSEIQDYCDDCGREDLHLQDGLCASCLKNYGTVEAPASHDINDGEHACNDIPTPAAILHYLLLANNVANLETALAWREAFGIEVAA